MDTDDPLYESESCQASQIMTAEICQYAVERTSVKFKCKSVYLM